MKRSEMVELIAVELEDLYAEARPYVLNCASGILDIIEKAGMLPPPVETISIARFECRLGQILKAEYPEKTLWEPEDEA